MISTSVLRLTGLWKKPNNIENVVMILTTVYWKMKINRRNFSKSKIILKRVVVISIHVANLKKTFDYYKKEPGLKNSFKNLFQREQLYKEAVRGLSFDIGNGEIVGFLGPNGAGKTTTLKMLSGILFPTSGEAQVDGYIPWERKKDFKFLFSVVMGQKSQLWVDLPASESLLLTRHIYELDHAAAQKTQNELAELLDVKHLLDIQVRRLSLGERMKLELIASLLHQPKILFLDEPTIGLDFISQKRIREFLKYYNQQKKTTIILTSHYMNDIEALCKRTIIINEGSIVYDGDVKKIATQLGDKKLVKIQYADDLSEENLSVFGTVKSLENHNAVIEVDSEQVKSHLATLLKQYQINDFTIENVPVEESIIALYSQGGGHV